MTNYNVDIVSDTVCPWCYIGKKRLELAIRQHLASNPNDTFTTAWHPFYLNPDAPKSVDKQAYYEQRFGAQRTSVMQAHIKKLGAQYGVDFSFGGRTGNTRDSHRLMQLGKTKGEKVQTRVVEELFNAYFEKEEDITSIDTLIARGVQAGLPSDEVKEWLTTDKGGPEVDTEVSQAQRKFISGVPNFTINGKYEVQGAEAPSEFLQIFDEIKRSETKAAPVQGKVTGGEQVC